jgi:hypothetical protein
VLAVLVEMLLSVRVVTAVTVLKATLLELATYMPAEVQELYITAQLLVVILVQAVVAGLPTTVRTISVAVAVVDTEQRVAMVVPVL